MTKKSIILDQNGKPLRDASGISPSQAYGQQSTPFGNLNTGGYFNSASGAGSCADKGRQSFFLPTRITNRIEFETIYNESWAAKKFVNIPIDDMFLKPRQFEGVDDDVLVDYDLYFQKYQLTDKLANALKLARLMGSGFLVFITKEAPLTEPLDFNELVPGDLANILALDRFDLYVTQRNEDIFDPLYSTARMYNVVTRWGNSFEIHASRVLRFDGQQPLTSNDWSTYDIDYGVSEIIPVIQSIYQESQLANGLSQLVEESSVPVLKLDGFRDLLTSAPQDQPALQDLMSAWNLTKSIYNAQVMDKEDGYERTEVSFTGMPDVYDRFAKRLAAAANIPATRFWGQSPLGMNATGDHDMRNYVQQVASDQEHKLRRAYRFIDRIMMRTSGIKFTPDYIFPSLMEVSENEQADLALKKVQAAVTAVSSGLLNPQEGRDVLDGDAIIGNLDENFEPDFDYDYFTPQQLETDIQDDDDDLVPNYMQDALAHGARKTESGMMFKPPSGAASNAKKVLNWRDEHGNDVKGMTRVGWTRANQLASREYISPKTVKRMASFARHQKNSKINTKFKSEPWKDKGYVAWLGWGGDSGVEWAKRASEWYDRQK